MERRRGHCAILGRVTEEQIRGLLASVEPSPFIDRTPGTVALLRSRVEEAGGDPEAVARWVEAKGGRVDRTLGFQLPAKGQTPGHKLSRAQFFYVVPTEALAK